MSTLRKLHAKLIAKRDELIAAHDVDAAMQLECEIDEVGERIYLSENGYRYDPEQGAWVNRQGESI